MDFEIISLLEAYRAACLLSPTIERSRVLADIVALAPAMGADIPVFLWNFGCRGWQQAQGGEFEPVFFGREAQSVLESDPSLLLLDGLVRLRELPRDFRGVFVIENLLSFLAKKVEIEVEICSLLINLIFDWVGQSDKFILFLESEDVSLPRSLNSVVPTVRVPLPDVEMLKEAIASELPQIGELEIEKAAAVCSGLGVEETRFGVRSIVAKVARGVLPIRSWPALLLDYKVERFASLGLSFVPTPNIPEFGGMDRLKQEIAWVGREFEDGARDYNIPLPKGWLLVGPPGTGKSLSVKVTAAKLGFPLINAEIGAVLSGGAAYLEGLIRRVEATAPALLWLDEFDKFFTGKEESGAEQGSSAQVLGFLLNWLQEKRSKVFVMAALNRLSVLPPELTRAGRFNKIFYVDFPHAYERKEIFELHLSRFDSRYPSVEGKSPLSDKEWRRLLAVTVKCSGAEIFEIVSNAARAQFHSARSHEDFAYRLDLDDLLVQREMITPLYARDTDRIIALENQAKYVAQPVSSPDVSEFAPVVQTLWGEAV